MIVEQAIERDEAAPDTQPRQVIESVLGPIHLRLLLTGEPISPDFLQAIIDVVVDGIAQRRAQGRRMSPR
jgi:Tetracyclin repressor-like, C-terminal domain